MVLVPPDARDFGEEFTTATKATPYVPPASTAALTAALLGGLLPNLTATSRSLLGGVQRGRALEPFGVGSREPLATIDPIMFRPMGAFAEKGGGP